VKCPYKAFKYKIQWQHALVVFEHHITSCLGGARRKAAAGNTYWFPMDFSHLPGIFNLFFHKLYKICSKRNVSYFIMPVTSEADAGGNGSQDWIFPPVFCYILLLCDRWQQRGSLLKCHLTWECKWSKGWNWISTCRKNCTYWDSSTLAECLWRSNSGFGHSKAEGGAFQWWQQWQWITSAGKDFYKYSMQALVHCLRKCIMMVTILKNSILWLRICSIN